MDGQAIAFVRAAEACVWLSAGHWPAGTFGWVQSHTANQRAAKEFLSMKEFA